MARKKKIRILISAWAGTRNTGDNAIFMGEVRAIRKYVPKAEITAFTQNIDNYIIDKLSIRSVSNRFSNLLQIINEIISCDIFILGGGGLIQEKTSIFTIFHHCYKTILAGLYKKKIIAYSLGIEKIKSKFNKIILSLAFKNAKIIMVRDKKSKKNLLDINKDLEGKIKVTADCALNLFSGKKQNKSSSKIGICVRDWFIYNKYLTVNISRKISTIIKQDKHNCFIKKMTHCIQKLIEEGYSINLIPFEGVRDEEAIQKIALNLKGPYKVIKWHSDPRIMCKIISEMDLIVGMRLHSLVLGAAMEKKLISINYSEKVKSFMDSLGLYDNQFSLLFQSEKFIKKIEIEIMKKSIDYKAKLSELRCRERENIMLLKKNI
ncbi:hypothetical protein GF323_04555 [Candidatus Woesearchaeota archaeon]|nr:hypothetical protein [Candidatus Woesearchaeota archaeon]